MADITEKEDWLPKKFKQILKEKELGIEKEPGIKPLEKVWLPKQYQQMLKENYKHKYDYVNLNKIISATTNDNTIKTIVADMNDIKFTKDNITNSIYSTNENLEKIKNETLKLIELRTKFPNEVNAVSEKLYLELKGFIELNKDDVQKILSDLQFASQPLLEG